MPITKIGSFAVASRHANAAEEFFVEIVNEAVNHFAVCRGVERSAGLVQPLELQCIGQTVVGESGIAISLCVKHVGQGPIQCRTLQNIQMLVLQQRLHVDKLLLGNMPQALSGEMAQVLPNVCVIRIGLHRQAQLGHRVLETPELGIGVGQVTARFRKVWATKERAFETGHGFAKSALLNHGQAQIPIYLRQVGLELQSRPELLFSFVETPQLQEGKANMVAGFGIVAPKAQRLPAVGKRFLKATQPTEREAEVVVGLGIIWPQMHRILKALHGLRQLAGIGVKNTEVVVGHGVGRVGFDSLAHPGDGPL